MTAVRIEVTWAGKQPKQASISSNLRLVRKGHPATMLIQGDNLAAMGALAHRSQGCFALAYLDPPFLTGKQHLKVTRSRKKGRIVRTLTPAFDDRWDDLSHYLSALAARISAARELLAEDGCLVLHVDPKTSHYCKILCDEIFGPRSFASEIVWRYRRWPAKTANFQRVHDVLLRYVKNPDVKPRFCQLYEPLAPSTLATWGDRKQRAIVDESGRRARSSTTEEATPGTPLGDVWDIGIVAPVSRERTGYPTQKPQALLKRIVEACSQPGDLVLDPYMGSGTTLVVATELGRRSVGIDESAEALSVTRQRLRAKGIRPLEERIELAATTRCA